MFARFAPRFEHRFLSRAMSTFHRRVAFGWMLYMGSRALFTSPECLLTNRKARCSAVRPAEVAEAGEKW